MTVPVRHSGSLAGLLAARLGSNARYDLVDADGEVRSLTPAALLDAAARIADGLRREWSSSCPPAGSVVLAVANPLDFIAAFFGVSLAGLVPAPAPGRFDMLPAHRRRLESIIRSSGAGLVITSAGQPAPAGPPGVAFVTVDALRAAGSPAGADPAVAPADGQTPAYIQYTSGSTSEPKPIVVRQRHVLAQLQQAAAAFGEDPDCVSVSWVPLHHDMGLVTSVLRPLWSGYRSVLLDPGDFVRRPRRWPEALTRWRATHTSAPDFGYALSARKAGSVDGLDLRALRVARSAGELVRPSTLQAFAETFGPAGFRYSAFTPSYGMAEATLTVTTCPPAALPELVTVSRAGLRANLVEPPRTGGDAVTLVSAGPPLADTCVRILASTGDRSLADRQVGEVWISGPQVVDGGPEHALDGMPGRRTGDLGFLSAGELILLGRARDRFQIRGENYYSTELEAAVAAADPRVRPGRVAVFAAEAEAESATDPEVVVLAEVAAEVAGALRQHSRGLEVGIRRRLSQEFGLSAQRVRWFRPGSLPVTTSGKLQREQCRERYLAGLLEPLDGGDRDGQPP